MLNGDHCDCCAFAQQSPPYDGDGICPKCKTEGEIKFNDGNLLCLACGSYVDGPDKPVSELYAQIAQEGLQRHAWIDLVREAMDKVPEAERGPLDKRFLTILRGDYGEED